MDALDKPWRPDNSEWMRQRKDEWDKIGQPILNSLIESENIKTAPFSKEHFREYFFTGRIPGGVRIPFYYQIMLYPRANDRDFVEGCFAGADDQELVALLKHHKYINFYKNNKAFAEVIFSGPVTDRLSRLGLKGSRDKEFIKRAPFALVIRGGDPLGEFDLPYYLYNVDNFVPVALELISESNNVLYARVTHLMRLVAHFVEPSELPGSETTAKRYANIFYHKFEHELPKHHVLHDAWANIKKCRFPLESVFGSRKDEFTPEGILAMGQELREKYSRQPVLLPMMSKISSDYPGLLSELIGYLKEYEICNQEESFKTWNPVDISGLLSPGVKNFFSLPSDSVPALHYQFKIDNCAFRAEGIARDELAHINLFVVPDHLGAQGEFEQASILIIQQNGFFQTRYIFPDEIVRVYFHILKWCTLKTGLKFETFMENRYGERNISQEDREKDYQKLGVLYHGFDLCGEGIDFLENPLRHLKEYDGQISGFHISDRI